MKKNLCLSMAFLMGLIGSALAGCGGTTSSSNSSQSEPSKPSETSQSEESVTSSEAELTSSAVSSSEEDLFRWKVHAEPIKNKPSFKLFFEATEYLAAISVTVSYRDINSKTVTHELDQYDLLKGFVEIDGNFGINKVDVVGIRRNGKVTEKLSLEVGCSAEEYNICPLIATVPVTIYSLSFPTYTNNYTIPTLFYLERGTAWSYSHLPENTYAIPLYTWSELLQTRRGNYQERCADYVKELYSIDNTSKFNFFVNDMWCDAWFMSVYPLGMSEDQFTVKLLSDGTWSYSWFNEQFNTPLGQNNREKYAAIWERAKEKMRENGDFKQEYLEGVAFRNFVLAWVEDLTLKNSVKWLINRIDTIQSSDFPEIKELIANLYDEGSIERFNFGTMYSNLSEEDKEIIKSLYNLGDYFESSTEKGHTPVIALGTNNEPYLESYLKISQDVFGEEYDLYYKGHPAHPTYDGDPKKDVFEKLGIEELPASLAAELFYYFYPENVKYCGYGSSTFTNVGDDPSILVWGERYESRNTSYGDNLEYFVTPVYKEDPIYGSVVANEEHSYFLVQNVEDLNGTLFSSVTAYEFDDVEMVGEQVYDYDSLSETYLPRA